MTKLDKDISKETIYTNIFMNIDEDKNPQQNYKANPEVYKRGHNQW